MKQYKEITEAIYKVAKKVSKELPFHATGIEKQLQEAMAYEFRKAKKEIQAVREFFGEIYYNNFPVKDYRPDFVIFPDKNWKLSQTIIIETKFGGVKELASGREELFRYLYSSSQSSTDYIRNSNIGMLILWESTTTDMPTGTSKVAIEELESMELGSFQAREFNVIVETWEVDPKNNKKFIKTLVYK
tara:strand:+ start:110 stop:673 length:564 start_codon:yes stop_codon:yes gene_type:complete